MTRRQRLCADYVCWCDYLRPRAWRLWCRIPGTYRLYKWAERNQ